MKLRISTAAVAAAVAAFLTPVLAAPPGPITPASNCSFSDISGAGVTVTDCSGYYTGNLNNNADFPYVRTLLESDFAGLTLGSAIVEQIPAGSSPVNLATALNGDTVIGVHWGGGAGGGDTAFYRLTIGAGYAGLTIAIPNPNLDNGGLSNVALYSTTPVPEPETYALMLAGLGIIGFLARRRRRDG